jgi:ClpP class serine protease
MSTEGSGKTAPERAVITSMHGRSWPNWLADLARAVFWIILAIILFQSSRGSSGVVAARNQILERLQQERKSRVIAMIHGKDTVTLFGIPVASSITMEDSEAVLRAIRMTPPDQPIDMILHTPGGLVLAAEQIAKALADHKGKVTVFVPHYAMSGGTLIALAADEIVMDPNAVLGPVDPQIGSMPAASIVKVTELKKPAQVSDVMLVLADISAKARVQVTAFVTKVLLKHFPQDKAIALATTLTDGRFTHDYPITVETAKGFGLPISETMPVEIYQLMDLYPQTGTGRPSVLYVPFHQAPEARPEPATLPPSPPEPPQAPRAETLKP